MDIKFLNIIIPEVNYWISRTLFNNSFNKKLINCPTKMSDFWRSNDSVVDLIFNETSDPSGAVYDDGYHFRWKYRTINLHRLALEEPMLFKRIQVYYNCTWIYVAKDDPKFADIINLHDSTITIDDYDYPYGIKPSKYVNYCSHIVGTGSDQLQYEDPEFHPESESDEPYIIKEAENVFGLTEEELEMLEYLYLYRIGDYENIPVWECNKWYEFESPLSKWIFVYLDCYLNSHTHYEFLKTICTKEDGSFRCLCEKHFQDRIYEYLNKQLMTLEEKINKIGNNDTRTFVPYTLKNNTIILKNRIKQQDLDAGSIVIESIDKNPNSKLHFEFIYDGCKLRYGKDFSINNIDTESNKTFIVKLLKTDKVTFELNHKYQFMYNYYYHKTPITGIEELDSM